MNADDVFFCYQCSNWHRAWMSECWAEDPTACVTCAIIAIRSDICACGGADLIPLSEQSERDAVEAGFLWE